MLLTTGRPSYNVFIEVQNFVNKAFFVLLGVRDYIHVVDLAKGHIAALKKLKDACGCKVRLSDQKHIFNTFLLIF